MTENTNEVYVLGPYTFSIDQAREILQRNPRKPHPIPVQHWAQALGVDKSDAEIRDAWKKGGRMSIRLLCGDVDEEYALTKADLSIPVIVGNLARKESDAPEHMLLDGFHRLRRAYVEGHESIPAHILTATETRSIRSARR